MNVICLLIMLLDIICCTRVNVVQLDILSPFTSTEAMTTQRKRRHKKKYLETIFPKLIYSSHSVRTFVHVSNGEHLYGHHAVIYNPKGMLSVLEPLKPGGCSFKYKNTVVETSKQKECLVAVNAGFFNERTGECYGNIISDGTVVNTHNGLRSAGFGIRKDGGIVVGYFSADDLYKNSFIQLVSGIGWILRNGESYTNDSLKHEQCNLNNIHEFIRSKSSRTFIGHDSKGYVHIVQVDGKTLENGINLVEAAEMLKSFGLVNAINLNGGGASTFVVKNTLINYPSNVCELNGLRMLCPMNVSTILCVHSPDECGSTHHCNNNGQCYRGMCACEKGWSGKYCQVHSKVIFASDCCWRNYYLVIVLSAVVGLSMIFSVFICNLYLMYRSRYLCLAYPKERKDQLRRYLKDRQFLSSSNEEILLSERNEGEVKG